MGRVFHQARILGGLAGDRPHGLDEVVQRLLRLRLRRLDHECLGHDQREIDRRRMEPVVHEPLRDIESADAVLTLQAARRKHELVHAEPVERKLVHVPEARQHVVRVQDGGLGHGPEARPVRTDERVGAHEHAERPAKPADLADRLGSVVVESERIALPDDCRRGQEGLEDLPHGHRPTTRPAATVWLREGLVEVVVDDVEAHVAGARDAADRVQIRAVVVEERPRVVEDLRHLLDVLVEEA